MTSPASGDLQDPTSRKYIRYIVLEISKWLSRFLTRSVAKIHKAPIPLHLKHSHMPWAKPSLFRLQFQTSIFEWRFITKTTHSKQTAVAILDSTAVEHAKTKTLKFFWISLYPNDRIGQKVVGIRQFFTQSYRWDIEKNPPQKTFWFFWSQNDAFWCI